MNIDKKMLDLGFDISQYKGFEYWKEAVSYCKKKNIFKIEDIYKHIAKKYNTSKVAVEIAMRRCALNAREKAMLKYKKNGKMSNKIMLNLLKVKLTE